MPVLCAFTVASLIGTAIASTPAPPDPTKLLPTYEINLDLPPEQRWTKVVQDHERYIKVIIPFLRNLFKGQATDTLIAAIKEGLEDEYLREMQGYAAVLNLTVDDAILANAYYELTAHKSSPQVGLLDRSCTSIVAENANGTMYLARNQDYPPPFEPLEIHAKYMKGGKLLFEGTVFAGTIGTVTALARNGPSGTWAVSIDARDGFRPTLDEAVKVAKAGGGISHIFIRKALEIAGDSYEKAVDFFMTKPMIAPIYIIMAGAEKGQGAVISTNTSALNNDRWDVKNGYGGGWYLVETNYDHWGPSHDTRRAAAEKSMDGISAEKISLLGLWDVLSVAPVYNLATIHTELVDIRAGDYRTYRRHGPLTTVV